ncbi:hypothetical protein S83_060516 [Arachis hypogaea]
MSDLQWKKLKVLGVGSYGTVYLAIVVDEQTPYQSFIVLKSSIPKLAFSLKKEEQILNQFGKVKAVVAKKSFDAFELTPRWSRDVTFTFFYWSMLSRFFG